MAINAKDNHFQTVTEAGQNQNRAISSRHSRTVDEKEKTDHLLNEKNTPNVLGASRVDF